MNGDLPKIEIFEPFGQAFEMMKRILFQPFDFTKWLVIGFAAFISGNSGTGFRYTSSRDWKMKSTWSGMESLPSWFIPVLIGAISIGLVVALVLFWVTSRGRFIFTDCVVKNRATIVAPWKEYRREGNSFFLFSLALVLLGLLFFGLAVLAILLPGRMLSGEWGDRLHAPAILAFILLGLIWLASSIFFAVTTAFMVPVMYRRRCRSREAFFEVCRLIGLRPGPFILFVLFSAVLVLAFLVISVIATCLTCCLAAIPYISSVVLLPMFVWFSSFKLLFLQQFGSEFDVWAPVEVPSVVVPELPPEPPTSPVQ